LALSKVYLNPGDTTTISTSFNGEFYLKFNSPALKVDLSVAYKDALNVTKTCNGVCLVSGNVVVAYESIIRKVGENDVTTLVSVKACLDEGCSDGKKGPAIFFGGTPKVGQPSIGPPLPISRPVPLEIPLTGFEFVSNVANGTTSYLWVINKSAENSTDPDPAGCTATTTIPYLPLFGETCRVIDVPGAYRLWVTPNVGNKVNVPFELLDGKKK
jgi:hypothetical protein